MDGSGPMVEFERKAQRAYRLRCYPTKAQARQLHGLFGTARFVWNWALRNRSAAYRDPDLVEAFGRGLSWSGVDMSRMLTEFKKEPEFAWIAETPSMALTQKLRDQDAAFAAFYAGRGKYPRRKKALETQSLRFQLDPRQRAMIKDFMAGSLRLPSIGALKVVWSRMPGAAPKMLTLTRRADGRYFVSFAVEEVLPALRAAPIGAVGVDVGVKDLLISSDGKTDPNPAHLRRRLRYLKRAQRSLRRKTKDSHCYRRQKQRVARIHSKIADARNDAAHRATTALVRRAQIIGIEDLNVKGMVRNRKLARALADASLGELHRQLTYKAGWAGRSLVKISRWYPSSKTCSACGAINEGLLLKHREWTCEVCNAAHDRDVNAAKNIEAEALRVLAGTPTPARQRTPILAGTPAVGRGSPELMRVEGDTHRRRRRKPASKAPIETRTAQALKAGMDPAVRA